MSPFLPSTTEDTRAERKNTMAQETVPPTRLRTLTAQERTDFERTHQALHEQLRHTQATPTQQVRMRLVLWIIQTGLETNRADFALLDRLCGSEDTEPLPEGEDQPWATCFP
jgi:hypothetical protein